MWCVVIRESMDLTSRSSRLSLLCRGFEPRKAKAVAAAAMGTLTIASCPCDCYPTGHIFWRRPSTRVEDVPADDLIRRGCPGPSLLRNVPRAQELSRICLVIGKTTHILKDLLTSRETLCGTGDIMQEEKNPDGHGTIERVGR